MSQFVNELISKGEKPPSFRSYGELGISKGDYTFLSTAEPALDSVILCLLPKESIIVDAVIECDQGWEAVPGAAQVDLYEVVSGVWTKIANTEIYEDWAMSTTGPDKVRMAHIAGQQAAMRTRFAQVVAMGLVWTTPGGGWRNVDMKIKGDIYFRAADSDE